MSYEEIFSSLQISAWNFFLNFELIQGKTDSAFKLGPSWTRLEIVPAMEMFLKYSTKYIQTLTPTNSFEISLLP